MLATARILPVIAWQATFLGRYNFTGVHPVVLYGPGVLSVIIITGSILSHDSAAFPIGLLISWSLTAPYGAKWARLGQLRVTRAFAIGIISGLPGMLIYWICFRMEGGSKEGTPA
jgi:hypothetical protein